MWFFGTLPNAVAQGLVWGIFAIGVFFSYRVLDYADLTVDGSICTGGAICAILVTNGVPVGVALVVAVIAGMLCGFVTGFLHTTMGIAPILSGILTQIALWSVNLKIMGRANVFVSSKDNFVIITQSNVWASILVMVGVVGAVVALLYWLFGTQFGCAIRATGCNGNMARAQGVNTNVTKVVGLMISNGLVALSGALLTQYQGFADINMGRGAIVIGLAAVIIGGAIVNKLSTNFAVQMGCVVVGSIVYYLVLQVVINVGFDTELLKLFTAILVTLFLSFPHLKRKFSKKRGGKNA